MDSLTLKITYDNDTRKITCPSDQIYSAIAERFGKPSPHGVQLWFEHEVVDMDQIRDLAAVTKPGKALKLEMRYDGTLDSSDETSHDSLEEDVVEEDTKQLKEAAKAARQAAKVAKNEAKLAEKAAKQEAKAAAVAAKAAMVAQKKAAKQAAMAAKQEAKHKLLAKKKAAKEAKMANNPDAENNTAAGDSMLGKLLNVTTQNAVTGELAILPCGRVCFHVDTHPGNLRVNKQHQLQKQGGRGPWAQFSATPIDNGVFRLSSAAHPECFLGAVTPDGQQDPCMLLSGGMSFAIVDEHSSEGLWSFYPEGQFEPLGLEPPAPIPTAREVYGQLQEMITQICANTGIPIQMQDAPEGEQELVQMLNALHEFLPHPVRRIAMKKIGLREFELEPAAPEPNQEWDMMVDDLKEMGFDSEDENRKAIQEANGDLKKAIKSLVQASRQ